MPFPLILSVSCVFRRARRRLKDAGNFTGVCMVAVEPLGMRHPGGRMFLEDDAGRQCRFVSCRAHSPAGVKRLTNNNNTIMTSKEKIIGLAQRAQVAAQQAGYIAELCLNDGGLCLSLSSLGFARLLDLRFSYGVDEVLGQSLLEALSGSLQSQAGVGAKQEGGVA